MSLTAERNEQFSEKEYWEQRYADETEEEFDWFKSVCLFLLFFLSLFFLYMLLTHTLAFSCAQYDDLKQLLSELIPDRSVRILMLGCGNSTLSPSMHADGYTNIVNIDYSTNLIRRLSTRYPDQTYLEADITQLSSPSTLHLLGGAASFDIALDKGTMDALMAEGKSASPWNPSPKVIQDVRNMLSGVDGLLKTGGKMIYVTFGQPHFRKKWLEEVQGWHVETRTLGDMFHYFVYVATKKA